MTLNRDSAPKILLLHSDSSLIEWLHTLGYQTLVSRVRDSAERLQSFRPDLIWLDAQHGGFEALPSIREMCMAAGVPDLPILLAVPNLPNVIETAYLSGATDVILPSDSDVVRAGRLANLVSSQRKHAQTITTMMRLRRQWDQTFTRNPAVAVLVDANTSQIVDANNAAARFYGYTISEMRNMRLRDLEATGDLTPMSGSLRSYSHRLASGQVRDVKIFASPIEGENRELILMLVFDNTKRREAETAEVMQRNFAEALSHTAAVLTSTLDLNVVLDRILQQAAQVVPHDASNIMLIKDGVARMVRWRGYENRTTDAELGAMRLRISEVENFRRAMETLQPLAISDINQYVGWSPQSATAWVRSYVCAPIRWGERVVGFLNLDSLRTGRFSQIDAERLQALADQAAIAIRNAQLYRRIKRQAALLDRRVRERTAELDAERGQLSAILDAMAEGVAFIEMDANAEHPEATRVRYVNEALIEMTGYSAQEWQHQSLQLFLSEDQSAENFTTEIGEMFAALRAGQIYSAEYKMRRKNGTQFDAFDTTSPVLNADGGLIGAVTIVRDISREKALEQERMNFVANASHELRTPIANLKTRLYLARKQPDKLSEHLRVIEEVSGKMQRLVDDLLAISRFQRGVIQLDLIPLTLQTLIEDITSLQQPEAERKGQTLTYICPPTPIIVQADPERLNQVVTNLVTNAINYTPQGGTIEVRTETGERDGVTHGLIVVADSGIGIAPEHVSYIFQPFYRVASSVPGTGLGLSIASQIVELHGGALEVESEIGKGSQFRVWLPLSQNEQTPIPLTHGKDAR